MAKNVNKDVMEKEVGKEVDIMNKNSRVLGEIISEKELEKVVLLSCGWLTYKKDGREFIPISTHPKESMELVKELSGKTIKELATYAYENIGNEKDSKIEAIDKLYYRYFDENDSQEFIDTYSELINIDAKECVNFLLEYIYDCVNSGIYDGEYFNEYLLSTYLKGQIDEDYYNYSITDYIGFNLIDEVITKIKELTNNKDYNLKNYISEENLNTCIQISKYIGKVELGYHFGRLYIWNIMEELLFNEGVHGTSILPKEKLLYNSDFVKLSINAGQEVFAGI